MTERKRTEEALREGEQRYASVIAALEEGIIVQDASGSIITINSNAERLLGILAGQMLGMTSPYSLGSAVHENGTPFAEDRHPANLTLSTGSRSEEHTSELQSRFDLVCRLLLE